MDKVLLYDCETSGTDPQKDHLVEVAGLLWSVHHAAQVAAFSFVVHAPNNAAAGFNGISPALLLDHGVPREAALQRVEAWFGRADAIVAYNAAFDRSFLPQPIQQLRPWVCAQDDIDWPRNNGSNKLTDIVLAHGLGVSHAHRALVDVMNLARLLERVAEMGHPPGELLSRAMREKRRYKAVTGRFDPALNAKLKAAQFRWDPDRKEWWRRLAVEDVPQLQTTYPFAIVEAP